MNDKEKAVKQAERFQRCMDSLPVFGQVLESLIKQRVGEGVTWVVLIAPNQTANEMALYSNTEKEGQEAMLRSAVEWLEQPKVSPDKLS